MLKFTAIATKFTVSIDSWFF